MVRLSNALFGIGMAILCMAAGFLGIDILVEIGSGVHVPSAITAVGWRMVFVAAAALAIGGMLRVLDRL